MYIPFQVLLMRVMIAQTAWLHGRTAAIENWSPLVRCRAVWPQTSASAFSQVAVAQRPEILYKESGIAAARGLSMLLIKKFCQRSAVHIGSNSSTLDDIITTALPCSLIVD